jgi:hypothetical protein
MSAVDVGSQMRGEFCKPARQELQLFLTIDVVRGSAEPAFELCNPSLRLLHS